jgi:hypothetical protein
MKRKLFILAALVGVCALSNTEKASSLTFPLCNSGYCATHQTKLCTCPPGTPDNGHPVPCDTWTADCNFL